MLILLHRFVASTSSGAVGSMTQSSVLTGSANASQSSTLSPPSPLLQVLILGILILPLPFDMTHHSAHLSSLHPSYFHCIVHTADGSPLSIAGQGTLSSNSFYVPHVSLVPDPTIQLMYVVQITDHDYRVILDPDVFYIQDHCTGHLVGTGPRCRDSLRLWELHLPSVAPASLVSSASTTSSTSSFAQWHHCLGHLCGF
jgi:hypothetical protein